MAGFGGGAKRTCTTCRNLRRTIVEPEPEPFVDSKPDKCNGNEDFGARECCKVASRSMT